MNTVVKLIVVGAILLTVFAGPAEASCVDTYHGKLALCESRNDSCNSRAWVGGIVAGVVGGVGSSIACLPFTAAAAITCGAVGGLAGAYYGWAAGRQCQRELQRCMRTARAWYDRNCG